MSDMEKLLRRAWLFQLLIRLHCPRGVYYRALDLWGGNDGWRPLSMRHPEWFTKESKR